MHKFSWKGKSEQIPSWSSIILIKSISHLFGHFFWQLFDSTVQCTLYSTYVYVLYVRINPSRILQEWGQSFKKADGNAHLYIESFCVQNSVHRWRESKYSKYNDKTKRQINVYIDSQVAAVWNRVKLRDKSMYTLTVK